MQAELVCCICCSSPVPLDGGAEVGQVKRLARPVDQHSPLRQRFGSSGPADGSNACRNSWEDHETTQARSTHAGEPDANRVGEAKE